MRLEDTGLRPVAVGWIVEHIDSIVAASDLIAAHIDCSAGDTGWTLAGTGSIFAGTGLTVVATGWIAERIGSIVVGTDLTFGGIGSTFGDTGSTVAEFDSIVEDIDLILAEFERGFRYSSGYNFGFDDFGDNFFQMTPLGQNQPLLVLHILHTRIRRYCRSSRCRSSFDHVRRALEDEMI